MGAISSIGALPLAGHDPRQRVAGLFDAHYDRLYRLARRLSANAEDASDLVQETFLRVAATPERVPLGPPAEEAYLVRVLVNLRRDQWRKAKVRGRPVYAPPAVDISHEGRVVAQGDIWRALDALAPRRRAVIVMHEIEGLSPIEIARLLDTAAATVRWHLFRGRRELAAALHGRTTRA